MNDDSKSRTPENRLKTKRRSYLKAVAGGGLASIGASGIAVAQSEETVERAVTVDADGPVRTKEVPRAWDEHRLHAKEIVRNLQETHLDRPGVKAISLRSSESRVAGLNGFKAEIEVDSKEFAGGIPDSKDNIPPWN